MNERIARLQQDLGDRGVILEDPTDLFYLTGLKVSRGLLVVTNHSAVLYVDGRYFAAAQQQAPCNVKLLDKGALAQSVQGARIAQLLFDSATTSYDRFLQLGQECAGTVLKPMSRILKKARARKDSDELSLLKRAAALTWAGYQHAVQGLKEGVSEKEIAWRFEAYVRQNGASALSFEPIVAFGENSAFPHYRAGSRRLKKGDLVLIDVGAVVNEYRGDLTRVHFFGPPNPELEKMLRWVQQAQQAAFEAVAVGVKIAQLDMAARAVFRKAGVEEKFVHGLGHGIGLETHEYPSIRSQGGDGDEAIASGMVFTLEPGLYQSELGGVRWEDMVAVTAQGVEKLYPDAAPNHD
jgi:Xaa-Pro aminopeptidase